MLDFLNPCRQFFCLDDEDLLFVEHDPIHQADPLDCLEVCKRDKARRLRSAVRVLLDLYLSDLSEEAENFGDDFQRVLGVHTLHKDLKSVVVVHQILRIVVHGKLLRFRIWVCRVERAGCECFKVAEF